MSELDQPNSLTQQFIAKMQAAPARDLSPNEMWARRQAWRSIDDPHDVEGWGKAFLKYLVMAAEPRKEGW